jgi:hypothetical protein
MVKHEALRDPDEGGDRREAHRRDIADWFKRNADRIHEQITDEGEEYRKAMEARRLAGMPNELKPSWKGRGEWSILEVLDRRENGRGRRGRHRDHRRQKGEGGDQGP